MAISRRIVEDRKVPGTSIGPAGRGSITFGMDRPQTLDRLQNLFRDVRPTPRPMPNPRFPMPMPVPRPMPGPRGPMPMPLPAPREGLPPRPMPMPLPPPGMGPFRPDRFPDQMPRGRKGIMEAASMAYDDDDYGPFIPPSVIEMDRFDTDYGPQDEYLFDRERGFENRIFGIDPNYFRGGIASLLR